MDQLDDRLDVPDARSPRSTSPTRKPAHRRVARVPAPLMPPPPRGRRACRGRARRARRVGGPWPPPIANEILYPARAPLSRRVNRKPIALQERDQPSRTALVVPCAEHSLAASEHAGRRPRSIDVRAAATGPRGGGAWTPERPPRAGSPGSSGDVGAVPCTGLEDGVRTPRVSRPHDAEPAHQRRTGRSDVAERSRGAARRTPAGGGRAACRRCRRSAPRSGCGVVLATCRAQRGRGPSESLHDVSPCGWRRLFGGARAGQLEGERAMRREARAVITLTLSHHAGRDRRARCPSRGPRCSRAPPRDRRPRTPCAPRDGSGSAARWRTDRRSSGARR